MHPYALHAQSSENQGKVVSPLTPITRQYQVRHLRSKGPLPLTVVYPIQLGQK